MAYHNELVMTTPLIEVQEGKHKASTLWETQADSSREVEGE
jgi:hypothetical protein